MTTLKNQCKIVNKNSALYQLDVMARVMKDVLVSAGVVDPNSEPSYMELCAAGDDYANWKSQEDPELNGFIHVHDELPGENGDYITRSMLPGLNDGDKPYPSYQLVSWFMTRGHFSNETRDDRHVTHWKPIGIIVEDQRNGY